MSKIHQLKDQIQHEAAQTIEENDGRVLLTLATGSGKSRIPLIHLQKNKYERVALIAPTEDLRDNDWREEFDKWGMSKYWGKTDRYCYHSISKVHNKDYDLVILDEAHHITESNFSFFTQNNIKDIVALSATPPTDKDKVELLRKLKLIHSYHLSLDKAVEMGLVSPYVIEVIYTDLDRSTKNIKGGNAEKPFYQSEYSAYRYLTDTIDELGSSSKREAFIFKRLHLLNALPSKTKATKELLEFLPKNEKTLIFCGSIDQATILCEHTYHSETNDKDLKKFRNDEITRLSSVKALNEGKNIGNLDIGILTSFNSKEKDIIQRIGRIVRYRDDHQAQIIIFCCRNTKDEEWLANALSKLDKNNIIYYNSIDSYYAKYREKSKNQ